MSIARSIVKGRIDAHIVRELIISLKHFFSGSCDDYGRDDDQQENHHFDHGQDIVEEDSASPRKGVDETGERRDTEGNAAYCTVRDGVLASCSDDPNGEVDAVSRHVP